MQLKMFCMKNNGHYTGVTFWPQWIKRVLELQSLLQTVFWS
jgi:hypothetical protein